MINREIAGFFAQIRIILWKNGLLFIQNKVGIICELLFSCLFTLVFILMVIFNTPTYNADMNSGEMNVLRMGQTKSSDPNRTNYYYYPDNDFVKSIANDSLFRLKLMNPYSSYLNQANLIGLKSPNETEISEEDKIRLFAFIRFPDGFSSETSVRSMDTLEYSLLTPEYEKFYLKFSLI